MLMSKLKLHENALVWWLGTQLCGCASQPGLEPKVSQKRALRCVTASRDVCDCVLGSQPSGSFLDPVVEVSP
jgi:hypothetical protein